MWARECGESCSWIGEGTSWLKAFKSHILQIWTVKGLDWDYRMPPNWLTSGNNIKYLLYYMTASQERDYYTQPIHCCLALFVYNNNIMELSSSSSPSRSPSQLTFPAMLYPPPLCELPPQILPPHTSQALPQWSGPCGLQAFLLKCNKTRLHFTADPYSSYVLPQALLMPQLGPQNLPQHSQVSTSGSKAHSPDPHFTRSWRISTAIHQGSSVSPHGMCSLSLQASHTWLMCSCKLSDISLRLWPLLSGGPSWDG